MEQVGICRRGRFSLSERLVAIALALVAVVSPLYIDRRQSVETGIGVQPCNISSCLPLLLLVLIMATSLSIFRRGSFSSNERLVAIGLALVAVVSPLYIDRRQSVETELDVQPINSSSYLPLLLLVLMISLGVCKSGRFSSYDRPVAIVLALVAVVSPLYIDRRQTVESELFVLAINNSSYLPLPLLLLVLIIAITLSSYLDRSFSGFDPYWIHRAGGSSYGIIIALVVGSIGCWEDSVRRARGIGYLSMPSERWVGFRILFFERVIIGCMDDIWVSVLVGEELTECSEGRGFELDGSGSLGGWLWRGVFMWSIEGLLGEAAAAETLVSDRRRR
ncbi:hypothetical protein F0562_003018 [Nyssa sinensis]|uniref:Uncharacterized protein n=1 Tax=Nyssa sinensis TaxID=561372 RepID=A0A5J5BT30_9ASTE|nr:hypothetical protein F0562_003018 [Nyssa sinensis]